MAGSKPEVPLSLEELFSQPIPPRVKKKIAVLSAVLAKAMMKKDDDQ